MGRLDGKVAVITGAASGIGAATAELFVAEGARVVIGDIQDEVGEKVAGELGANARFRHCNVAREADVAALVAEATDTWGRLDVLYNNAGFVGAQGPFETTSVDEYDLSPIGQPNASKGSTYEGRVGLRWHPDDGNASGLGGAGATDREREAWGVSKNYGWAVGEVLAINLVSSGLNEYVRNANFNQISPRSWWANLEHGFTYDDNEFKTNQYLHPWNGAAYFNSARGNGLGYWTSSAFAERLK